MKKKAKRGGKRRQKRMAQARAIRARIYLEHHLRPSDLVHDPTQCKVCRPDTDQTRSYTWWLPDVLQDLR